MHRVMRRRAALCLRAVLGREPRQRLRVGRSLTAAGVYLFAMLIQAYTVIQGMADGGHALALSLFMGVAIGGFYVALRSGWSRRLADPAMTLPQMALAIACLAFAYLINAPVRGMLLMLVALVLMFGAFTLSPLSCRRLGWASVAAMGAAMGASAAAMPGRIEPHVELIHFMFSAAVLPTLGRVAGQLSGIRISLKSERAALVSALAASGRTQRELSMQVEKEAMYRQILDAVSEAVLVKGPHSAILWANRSFREFYGMGNEQFQGLVDAPFVAPDLTLQYVRDDAQVFANGVALDIPDEATTRHDGVTQRWHTVKSPIFDSTGAVVATVGVSRDITAQLLARQSLRASQVFLDQTGRIGGVGGWSIDVATRALQWTDQTCRIHGREPGHQPTVEDSLNAYPPQARPVIEQALRHSVASGQGFDLELPLVNADGLAIWVRVVAEPEVVDGRVVRVLGALQDITARRTMETALRRNGELLTSVLEHIPCGLSAYDADLKFLTSNVEYRRLLGLPEALLCRPGVGLEDVLRFNAARGDYGAGDVEATVQAFIAAARGSQEPYAMERTRPDGTTLEIRGAPMPGGGFVLTHNDFTARRQAEQVLRRQTERLRLAADSAGIGVWEYDLALGTLEWDDWMYRIYRETRTGGVQPVDLWSRHLHPDDAARVLADMNATLEGRGDFRPEYRICRPDGEVRYVRSAAHVERDAAGQPLRMIGVNIDVTPQRLSEQALREAKLAAESANAAKSQFLANMSHEIRTPMNAVLGMLTLLRRTELTPRQADYAAKTDGAARALLGLLDELLDFSKIEAGRMTLDPQAFRVDHLLRDLSVVLSASLGAKDVDLLFDIDPVLPRWLVGDAMRLRQVLVNLGGNAVKFTATGHVVVALTVVARGAAEVTLEVAVRDTGIGIAPENHARIFAGFTQAEASTTRRFGGTGLGLALSQRLVALMGGELGLDSAPGEGSRFHFRITLPLAALGTDEASDQVAPAAPLRALLVDDNPQARAVLERLGRSLGWTMDLADSGEAALALLETRADAGTPCAAVFVDAQMPGMDGWQTCARIRELGAWRAQGSAPIILMLTAHGREAVARRSRAERALADGFLVKPVTASMLFDALVDARSAKAQPHPSRPSSRPTVSAGQRLAGMRVLVAEDNPNNQQVVRELLEDEGARVQIADHGQAAVALLGDATESTFDAVLMDLQMPVMDGYTATRTIRQELGLRALPIVAMTANAMASDRAACLAAGMDDHVAKPFDLDHLVRVLRRLTSRLAAPDSRALAAATPLPTAAREAAAAAGVDVDGALIRLGGKHALYVRMLGTFTTDLTAMPAQLQSAQDDVPRALRQLHTLKGLAGGLGDSALAAAAARAEQQLAGAVEPAQASAAIEEVCSAMGSAGPRLDALLRALQAEPVLPAPAAASFDPAAFAPALRALAEQLRHADMAATDAMDALLLAFGSGPAESLRAMDEAIARLDFEHALRLCDGLIARTASERIEGECT